jgi:hypothetical protein
MEIISRQRFFVGLLPLFFLVCLALVPGIASANSGAPLIANFMMDSFMVYMLGIALVEAVLLAWFFKAPFFISLLCLFFGNVFSGFLGVFLFVGDFSDHSHSVLSVPGLTIYNFFWYPYAVWLVAYLLSVLSEFPFFLLAMFASSIKEKLIVRTTKAAFLIHIPFYVLAAPVLLYQMHHNSISGYEKTHDLAFLKDSGASVYYFSTGGDKVLRSHLDGTGQEEYLTLEHPVAPGQSLLWLKAGATNATLDLCLVVGEDSSILKQDFVRREQWRPYRHHNDAFDEKIEDSLGGKGKDVAMLSSIICSDFRQPDENERQFRATGNWYLYSHKGKNWRDGTEKSVFNTPVYSWRLLNLSVLPEDKLVFALGDQICAMDYPNHRIGVIARGYRPLVVLDADTAAEK